MPSSSGSERNAMHAGDSNDKDEGGRTCSRWCGRSGVKFVHGDVGTQCLDCKAYWRRQIRFLEPAQIMEEKKRLEELSERGLEE